MKILLLGEYSNLHWLLAQELRLLGHKVNVASDGDGLKNYKRDIDLKRNSSGIWDTFAALCKVIKNLKYFRGNDIVQIINPNFTQLNVLVNKFLYRYLKKHNRKVFLGAFGDDSFWLRACLDNKTFRYSEFYVNGKENKLSDNERLKKKWLNSATESLNIEIADSCDGIIACLYEYYASYEPKYKDKLTFIPLPMDLEVIKKTNIASNRKINFFIGINRPRHEFKGTDRLHKVLLEIYDKYPDEMEITVAESLQYNEYLGNLEKADVVLDQIYSYSPAMNGLLTLAMGKVLVSGGEPEMYDILNEKDLRPIVNVYPSEEDIYNKLENIIIDKDRIPNISDMGRIFVERHHDVKKVAQKYLDFWAKN